MLAGWHGGLDHFSWMRFRRSGPGQPNGTWEAIDAFCGTCTPYFACEGGDGLFIASTGSERTLTLQLPLACAGDGGAPASETWTLTDFSSPGPWPPGPTLVAQVQIDGIPNTTAYLYPTAHCDTGCAPPW